jgi:hypothetical protein
VGQVDLRRWGACLKGRELTKGPVRPGGVVVPQVFGQYLVQVALIDDQQPVGDLAAQGADHPLANGIRPRCLRRAEEDPDACGGEYGIEGAGELAGAVPDQEPGASRAPVKVHEEVTAGLSRPGAVRVGGDAGQASAAGAVLDDDQGIDPPQQDRVDGDEVGREDAVGLGGQELLPVGPVCRGAGSIPASGRICQTVEAAM